jgi:FHA domain
VLDKLRRLFSGSAAPPVARERLVRPRPGAAKRPAGSRIPRGSAAGRGPASIAVVSETGSEGPPEEIACPSCGEPMIAGWGTTCGKCRPSMVAPKTMFTEDGHLALPSLASAGLVLGWLVILRSVDEEQIGRLVELDRDTVVLSRGDMAADPTTCVLSFQDAFMSSGHAVLRRPFGGQRSDAFTIRDRQNPGPSANGTFVNAHKLRAGEEMRLGDGDVVKVGASELLFRALWLPPAESRHR